ncbi:ABC transporter permease [Planomicrobium chinense]|uniref:ABC transporter permease n=1 Tax=Planococcus chinensis TaxID=272917 RepID=UPI001CC7F471|nr:ABC transporter permease [Planococcus chinensis]MBZ5201666.1 ABC transporter permease [Planococcus chinensis]
MKNVSESPAARLPRLKAFQLKGKLSASNLSVFSAGFVLLFIILCALFPAWIAPYPPTKMFTDQILAAPSAAHLFGTDYFGRDVFSLVVHGSRDSLIIGVAAVLVGGLIGGALGAIAGYAGGIIDAIFMRIVEILMTIPGILLALAIAAALGPSLKNIVLAIAISSIPGYARVMRGQMISIKKRPYIAASRSIGTSNVRILLWHILPNAWPPILVMATIGLGSAILTGAGLSFLGLGVIKEVPDWGALLSQGRNYLTAGWWMATFPGLAITAFVLAINIVGDKLQEETNPKLSKGR